MSALFTLSIVARRVQAVKAMMCGIVGFQGDFSSELLGRMTLAVAHRGPDGVGTLVRGPIGFAHRRLAIIDLNERSAQPMSSSDGAVCVTFNGEIFNFPELRAELEAHAAAVEAGTGSSPEREKRIKAAARRLLE